MREGHRLGLVVGACAAILGVVAWRRRVVADGFGAALVAAALADLGVSEDLGKNDGKRIREFFSGSRITPPANWCAAAATAWIREASRRLRIGPPIEGSLQAKQLAEQIKVAARTPGSSARWHDVAELRRDPSLLQPGMLVVWDRSDSRPETSWFGHVGIVSAAATQGVFGTVEGNSGPLGDRVARMARRLDDPRLLGAGRVA